LLALVVVLASAWGALALWYQAPHQIHFISVVLWSIFVVAILGISWRGRTFIGTLSFVVAFTLLLVWWTRLAPSNDHVWADDVAQMTTGTVAGNDITLHNVRNFDWRSDSDYTQRWETRHYELDRLRSVDLIMSYWSGRAIAHMLISFGFDSANGVEQVAFSVEVRREKDEGFSEIGGFFKKFELSVIAADERDVIRVRTNIRNEDDYLYRVQMPLADARALLLAYIDEANSLVSQPRFYNTVTTNCTTLVYTMMEHIVGPLPLSPRLLLTGYLPEYVYDAGALDHSFSLEELRTQGRITERAKQSDRSATFSRDIRRGVPGNDQLSREPARH
jgi:Domain of unknown function (DUF4105)